MGRRFLRFWLFLLLKGKIMPKKIADVLATFRAKRKTKGLRVALKWLFKKRRKG